MAEVSIKRGCQVNKQVAASRVTSGQAHSKTTTNGPDLDVPDELERDAMHFAGEHLARILQILARYGIDVGKEWLSHQN